MLSKQAEKRCKLHIRTLIDDLVTRSGVQPAPEDTFTSRRTGEKSYCSRYAKALDGSPRNAQKRNTTMTTPIKRHPLLTQITSDLSGRRPRKPVEVLGHTYTLELLMPEAEDWVAANTSGMTIVAANLNTRKPTIACALTAIDDLQIEALFPFESDDQKVREFMATNPNELRLWRRVQVLEWLKNDVDPYVVDELWNAYRKLQDEHYQEMKKLENFSKRTPLQT